MGLFTHHVRRWMAVRSIYIAGASAVTALALSAAAHADQAAGNWHQDGQASYYGRHWSGHRTSSGAVFDPLKLTAAHASLPLGTRLLVTSQDSGQSVIVTVNDREPDHGHRIIDLSPAAARRLGMIGSGTAEVVVTQATPTDICNQQDNDEEVAEAPDEADDQDVAPSSTMGRRSVHHVSRVRHGQPHRLHARR